MLKFKNLKSRLPVGTTLTSGLSDITRDDEDKLFRAELINAQTTVENAEDKCRTLTAFDIPCEVHIYTSTYNEETLSYKVEPTNDKKG